MRVGMVLSRWTELPPSGIQPAPRLDYADFEKVNAIAYREMGRAELEEVLEAKSGRAIWAEAWGALYLRDQLGIHQVHSRRASCSVRTDLVGRDGAIRFYYREDSRAEMLLFKYCGQV